MDMCQMFSIKIKHSGYFDKFKLNLIIKLSIFLFITYFIGYRSISH
jgi:hypothetical protein